MEYSKIKQVAKEAGFEAGKELYQRFLKFDRGTVKFKSGHEIVTQADLASEKIILKKIKSNFPDHRILSEESGDTKKNSDYLWVVDPLDGTTNFSMHNPLWSISIAVLYKRKVFLGLVYAPFLDELFLAEMGKGSKLYSPAKNTRGKKLKVSGVRENRVLNTFCHGTSEKDIQKTLDYYRKQKLNDLDCRQLGSAAIELAFVAAGRVESIVIPGAHAWDVAAGVLLVRESGGKVTDASGKPWSLNSQDMVATNGRVHKQVLEVLK